jgi:hypothetical protein
MRWTVGIVAVALVTGCASGEAYKEKLASWEGAPESSLIASWGAPSASYRADDGTKIITYRSSRTYHALDATPATYETTRTGPGMYSTVAVGGSEGVDLHGNCTTTFTIAAGRVTGWHFQGNDCR